MDRAGWEMLTAFGLKNIKFEYLQDNMTPPGTILRQDPASGTIMTDPEAPITLTISQEPKQDDIPPMPRSGTKGGNHTDSSKGEADTRFSFSMGKFQTRTEIYPDVNIR
jgi:hypothetical protein